MSRKPTEPEAQNRVLHMSDRCREHLEKARAFSIVHGIHAKFLEGIEYLRTYSGGPEEDWKSELYLDIPLHQEDWSFMCQISRRIPSRDGGQESLRGLICIGMIWRKDDKEWTFHS